MKSVNQFLCPSCWLINFILHLGYKNGKFPVALGIFYTTRFVYVVRLNMSKVILHFIGFQNKGISLVYTVSVEQVCKCIDVHDGTVNVTPPSLF